MLLCFPFCVCLARCNIFGVLEHLYQHRIVWLLVATGFPNFSVSTAFKDLNNKPHFGIMGGCVSTEEKKRSQEIDRMLNGDRKKLREEVKLLLLGMLSEFNVPGSFLFVPSVLTTRVSKSRTWRVWQKYYL